MSYKIPLDFNGNRHPSKLAGNAVHALLDKHKIMVVVKDTGAGGTTGLGAATIDSGEVLLLVGPTRLSVGEVAQSIPDYADNTVLKDKKYAERDGHEYKPTYTFPTARDCPIIADRIARHPELKEWDLHFTNCSECSDQIKATCPLYQSVQITPEDDDRLVYGLTYHGAIASILSEYRDARFNPKEPSLGTKRIAKILKKCDTIILDECHFLELARGVQVPIWNVTDGMAISYKSKFCSLMGSPDGQYPHLKEILTNVDKLVQGIQKDIEGCIKENAEKADNERILNISVKNPYFIDLDNPEETGKLVTINEELIQLHCDPNRYVERNSCIKNILLPLTKIMSCERLVLQIYFGDGEQYIDLVADNRTEMSALDDFIRMMVNDGKKIVFLTATKGRHNYSKYLPNGGHIKTVLFGKGGDPTDSAGAQVILPDTWKMSSGARANSFNVQFNDIKTEVLGILQQHGRQKSVVVCRTAKEANRVRRMIKEELKWVHDTEHREAVNDVIVTYYRGPDSHSGRFYFNDGWGKKHHAEVMILIGSAETPGHCMDPYSKTVKESREKRQTEINMQMFQMCGRIKGNGRSMVYCIGINAETVSKFIVWGTSYKLEFDDNPTHPHCTVKVEKPINKATVIECKTPEERLERGRLYLNTLSYHTKAQHVEKTEISSDTYIPIVEKRDRIGSGFSPQFWVPPFRQLPKLPSTIDSVIIYDGSTDKSSSLVYIYRELGLHSGVSNFIILVTDTDSQILEVGKFALRTPADHTNFKGSIVCDSVETANRVLEHYRGPAVKEMKRSVAENRMRDMVSKIRVSTSPVKVETGELLLSEVFGLCNTRYATQVKDKLGNWQYFTARDIYGNDKPLGVAEYFKHMEGNQTILTYTISDQDKVGHITFDIDAHRSEKDTEAVYLKKLEGAEVKKNAIIGLLNTLGINPLPVKSGSPGSYHIVVKCLPVKADKAYYFAKVIMDALGYSDPVANERFPKQHTCQLFYGRDEVPWEEAESVYIGKSKRRGLMGPTVDETPIENYLGYGNGTKIPLGKHRKSGKWSYLYHPEEKKWVRYHVKSDGANTYIVDESYWIDEDGNKIEKQYVPVWAIDIRAIEVQKEVTPAVHKVQTKQFKPVPVSGMHPLFAWAIQQQNLVGSAGHILRVGIFYELAYGCGMTDDQIFEVFKGMGLDDFGDGTVCMENIKRTRAVGHSNPYRDKDKIRAMVSDKNWENFMHNRPYEPDEYRPPEEMFKGVCEKR